MKGRSFLWAAIAVGCLGGFGLASPSYSSTIAREQRASRRSHNASTPDVVDTPTLQPLDGDLRDGRHLILETLSALAALKLSKRLGQSSTVTSVKNWFANPFNVTLSLGIGNGTNGRPVYSQVPIYNAVPAAVNPGLTGLPTAALPAANYPGVASASAAVVLYRGEACNANAWPPCSTGTTPCNDNALPACYFTWPSCNSNALPNCNAVLGGVACNNNTLPYCVDIGVPCNSNDLNFCINAPAPCNDNNWPYCPGFGAFAASFDGVVNGVVYSGLNGGVNGAVDTTGPNGAFFGPSTNVATPLNTGTPVNAGNLGVNGAFFSPSNKVAPLGESFASSSGNAAQFIQSSAQDELLEAKPTIENLSGGLYDLLAQTNSTPPWTFELSRPNRLPKPLHSDAVQKYVVAIAPMVMPTLGMEAVTALGDALPGHEDYNDYRSGEEHADVGGGSMFGDDFGLELFGENRVKPDRDPRKPHVGVRGQNKTSGGVVTRKNWKAAKKPFNVKHAGGKRPQQGAPGNSTVRTPAAGRPSRVKSSRSPSKAPGALAGLPAKFHELAKISKVTFGAKEPTQRSWDRA